MINGIAAGPNNIEAKFLKLLNKNGITWITETLNNIYDTKDIPDEWLAWYSIVIILNSTLTHIKQNKLLLSKTLQLKLICM